MVDHEFRNGAGKPVIGLDIDGTLGDYHGHFLNFAAGWLGRPMPDPHQINPGMRLSEFMNIEHSLYQRIKLAYRQGGMKRTMPVYPHASYITYDLRKRGAEVWLCTTRPYNKLDNIDEDTREWLQRNSIVYDAILFDPQDGSGKYHELVRQVGLDRVVCVADDLTENLLEAEQAGIKRRYLRAQPYNDVGIVRHGIRVDTMYELWRCIKDDITTWEKGKAHV